MKHLFLITIAALISLPASAGWVVTYKDAESGERNLEYYDKGKANFGEVIYTGKHILVVDADAKAKAYWKGTPGQYCDALLGQMKKMEAQMASMPAQYRPVPISKKKVTRKEIGKQKIAGFNATGYDFYVDGNQEERIWISSDSGLTDIINFNKSMSKTMECLDNMDSMSVESSSLYKKTVEGAVVVKESYRQLVSVEKKNVPASHFDAPAGYKSFSDYDQFMNYLMNRSRSSSRSNPKQSSPSYEAPTSRSQPETSSQKEDNVVVKDAKDIASDTVDEAHQETKDGIQDEISKDVKKGVKGMLDKLF